MTCNHKIGIIFLDEIHHINHFITVAIELAKTNDVSIITHPAKHTYLHHKLNQLNGEKVKLVQLQTHWFRALTDKFKKRKLPRKNFWFKKNNAYIIKHFDAVIFTGFSHQYFLKAKKSDDFPKLIQFPHGFAGRDHGFYKLFKDFDFKLLNGSFDLEILRGKKLLINHAVVGYPKLDALKNLQKSNIFNNNKKTVIYCPHFSPTATSWNVYGLQILEYFDTQEQYNLIFAPHINLFNRKGGEDVSFISKKYYNSEKIYIDLGSEKSVDMVYLNAADIYLGDISSQIYEFIIYPRPCIFINPEKIDYEGNIHYRFWKCGEVIEEINKLGEALKNAPKKFDEKYHAVQKKINTENLYFEEGSNASERAAKAISKFLDGNT